MNIYSFGHQYLMPEIKENDLYVDAGELKKCNVGLSEKGTDKATRRKYLNADIREFYENKILFIVRAKEYDNVYIGCHQGKHKSVCLAEQLFIDANRRFENVTLIHVLRFRVQIIPLWIIFTVKRISNTHQISRNT